MRMAESESNEQPRAEPEIGERVSESHADHAKQQSSPPIQSSHSTERSKERPPQSSPSADENKWYQKRDPHITDWIIAGATVAMLLVAAVNAWIAREQWEAMRIQADLTKQQLIASTRPWVKVDLSVGGDLRFEPSGTYIKVRFTTKSFGTTPAVGVRVNPAVFLLSPLHGDLIEEQTRICTQGRNPLPPGPMIAGATLFPGEEKIWDIAIQVPQAQIEGVWKDMREFHKDNEVYTFFSPTIIGCVNYRFTFDDTLHGTPFSAGMEMRDLKSGHIVSIDTRLGIIPAPLLVLNQEMSSMFGWSYAY